jgi:glycosyltransferase involved in cell wall biosynthesis
MDNLTVSVAMCTYNGTKYVGEQLRSLVKQTVLPNELIICDDGSTDGTWWVLEAFSHTLPFKIQKFANEKPLGVTRNFEKAIQACTSDIIFLCDQDDVWLPHKVEKIRTFFEENPACEVIFGDAQLIDDEGKELPETLWPKVRFRQHQMAQWSRGEATQVMLQGNRATGCTMAVRRRFVAQILPFPTHIPNYIHDTWIAMTAAVMGVIEPLAEPLIKYRQHEQQQVGTREKPNQAAVGFWQRFGRPRAEKLAPILSELTHTKLLYEALIKVCPEAKNRWMIEDKIAFLTMRSTLSSHRLGRIKPVLTHLLKKKYHQYTDQDAAWTGGFLAALGDLVE